MTCKQSCMKYKHLIIYCTDSTTNEFNDVKGSFTIEGVYITIRDDWVRFFPSMYIRSIDIDYGLSKEE